MAISFRKSTVCQPFISDLYFNASYWNHDGICCDEGANLERRSVAIREMESELNLASSLYIYIYIYTYIYIYIHGPFCDGVRGLSTGKLRRKQ